MREGEKCLVKHFLVWMYFSDGYTDNVDDIAFAIARPFRQCEQGLTVTQ